MKLLLHLGPLALIGTLMLGAAIAETPEAKAAPTDGTLAYACPVDGDVVSSVPGTCLKHQRDLARR